MYKRRLFFSLLAMSSLFLIVIGRLFWIQVLDTADFSDHNVDLIKRSVAQRERGIVLDSGRGHFYDRSVQPLTGELVNSLVVFPVRSDFQGNVQQQRQLSDILHTSLHQWQHFIDQLNEPKLWKNSAEKTPLRLTDDQVRDIQELHLPGIRIMPYRVRYSEPYTAGHLIGYIGENPEYLKEVLGVNVQAKELLNSRIGASGLEKTFEKYLKGVGSTSISFFTDGKKRPLSGLDVRAVKPTNPYYPLKIITTLDYSMQQSIESLLDEHNIKQGAVVVLDTTTADVIAMASRPRFNPYDVRPDQGDWNNKALKAAIPGSIFKTVVAAAALEIGVISPSEKFECRGELGKYGFSCWKKGGHGLISFEEAYAQSCNIAFAEVMKRIPSAQLEAYAKRLGLNQKVGWASAAEHGESFRQFDGEERGQTFAAGTNQDDEGVRVQTAIGQRDVLMTPLQAANLMVTLLHRGEVMSPRIVKEITYQNDVILAEFDTKVMVPSSEGISEKTAKTLRAFMEEVVANGTGEILQRAALGLAGKTGTAEVGNGVLENQWFVGYGPTDQPRYAVAVMVQNVHAGSKQLTLPLFKDIMETMN